jgi:glycosyltransferase involved in cell wall biosynthesis
LTRSVQPVVSVVIPTRNRPAIVQRAVESALNQTVAEVEVIVVIDGPDAATRHSLAEIHDSRLRVIALPETLGGSEARNTGVRVAVAEWVALLDDDDQWMCDKLAKQLPVAKASQYALPIVASGLIARSPSADFRWPTTPPRLPLSEYMFVRNSFFLGEGILQTSTWLVKRELMLRVPFTPGLRRHQDWDWILRAIREPGAGLEFIPEPLAIWHIDDPRKPLRTQYDWRYSLEWIRTNRDLVTPRAYAGFVAVTPTAQAAWQHDWKAFFPLLREMVFGGGRPRLKDIAFFLAMWFVPRSTRQWLRSLFTSERPRQKSTQPSVSNLQQAPAGIHGNSK